MPRLIPLAALAALPLAAACTTPEQMARPIPQTAPLEGKCQPWPDIQDLGIPGPGLLGCSNRENLAAMVADPKDLEQGRALAPADGAHAAAAIDRYRTDKVKPFPSETATGGRGASLNQ